MALIKCPNCGKEVSEKAVACPNCGVLISNKKGNNKKGNKNDKTIIIVSVAVAIVVLIVGILCSVVLVSTDTYLSRGEYQKAYDKARDKETKEKVLLENIIAKYSYEISDTLKDPDSFKLKHVYYNGKNEIVFEIIGKNSFGSNVTNYYDYRYDKKEKHYKKFLSLSSLEEDKISSSDSRNTMLEKAIKNAIRQTINKIMSNSDETKVDDKVVDRVNKLFKQDKLENVKLIPKVSTIYP